MANDSSTAQYPRFHVVCVSKYIGIYDRGWYAYAVADRQHANRIVSNKYDDHKTAQEEANRLQECLTREISLS